MCKRLFSLFKRLIQKAVRALSDLAKSIGVFIRYLFQVMCTRWICPLLCSIIIAIVTCGLSYMVENQQSNLKEMAGLFHVLESYGGKSLNQQDTAFFINVSYDLQLVNQNPQRPSDGYVAITDRRKLFQFLQKVERDSIDYKYIFLDIRFEKGYETEYDDSLYAQIQRMPRLVIANHQRDDSGGEFEIADSNLLGKCGMSDYNQYGIVTNFSRYTFLQAGKPSIALKMYDDLHHQNTSVKQWRKWPVYYTDHHLCINSPMMYLSGTVCSFEDYCMHQIDLEEERMRNGQESGVEAETARMEVEQNNYYFYLNLGGDFVDNKVRRNERWNGDLDNKVIVIANFEDDVHDTYVGKVSGAYITWMAYQHLCADRHVLSWWFLLLNVLCYAAISYFLICLNRLAQKSRYVDSDKAQRFISVLRWVGSVGLLYLLTLILYLFMQVRFNLTVPFLMISLVNLVLQIINKRSKKQKIVQKSNI